MPDATGDDLVSTLLAEVEEEQRLSIVLGVDLTAPAPKAEHAPSVYAPLEVWLRRSEEVHLFREQAWRDDRRRLRR